MRIIEIYDPDGLVEIQAISYPKVALVEGDDGVRGLLLPDLFEIPVPLWERSYLDGARWLLAPAFDRWVGITVEKFETMRVREGHLYKLAGGWSITGEPGPPSYRALLGAYRDQEAYERSFLPKTEPFVSLHSHSEFSPLDGLSTVDEMVARAVEMEQPAIAVTDHARCAAHPKLQKAARGVGIKPIFGIEANLTDNRFLRKDDVEEGKAKELLADYRHLILWAETDEGLRNLWAMSTEANLTGFYGRPRIDWDLLRRFSTGLMVSTACLRGPLSWWILRDDEPQAEAILGRLLEIFPERLWIELHTNQMADQKKVNEALVSMATKFSLPVIAVTDSHYPCEADRHLHKIWLAATTDRDVTDDLGLFEGDESFHLMSVDEVRRSLDYMPPGLVDQAVAQTVVIADRCHVEIVGKTVVPIYSKQGGAQRDVDRVIDLCLEAWPRRVLARHKADPDVYAARFEYEMKILISKRFCGYFLMEWDQVNYAKTNHILVGPGRGSGAGSLVAYLLGITEVDPIQYDLLFERFITEDRVDPPDFDVDFPSSKRIVMQDYTTERFGPEYVMRVGTHTRFRNKGIIRALAKALGSEIGDLHYPDIDEICRVIDKAESHSAGLGIKWDELMEEWGEVLAPYVAKYPILFETAEKLVKRLRTYGRHAAGMVITTDEPLVGRFPMRASEESNQPISEFDMKDLEMLGLLKFDILTLRTLDTLQMCLDLIHEFTGEMIDVYQWDAEYDDPQVWDEICAGHTMGMFQVETTAVTKLTRRFQPRSIGDLADVITLVRPGPSRSGLTESYFRRKAGIEPVTYLHPRLEKVTERTYGILAYQEQVMAACQVLAGYSLSEADLIRRLMGKKEVEKALKAGEEFVLRCVEHGMEHQDATTLWDKLAEFSRYGFNLSHAVAYAIIAFICQWFKIHYPSIFLTAVLSTVDSKRIPDFVNEARRMGYKVLPPDINESGQGFRPVGGTTVRYGFEAVDGIGEAAVAAILQGQPYVSFEDFLERRGGACDKGKILRLVRAGAFDVLFPNRRALESQLEWEANEESIRCVNKDTTVVRAHGLPCVFDWDGEPVELTLRGKPKKRKEPPKKCTRACRHYTPPDPRDFIGLEPYGPAEIRERERELLGIYLSSTPFDRIPQEVIEEYGILTGSEIEDALAGDYMTAAVITKVKRHIDRHGNPMGFLGLYARDIVLDATMFKDAWSVYSDLLTLDQLAFFEINKNSRGITIRAMTPL